MDILDLKTIDAVLERTAALGLDWRTSRFARYRAEVEAHKNADAEFIRAFRTEEGRQRLAFETASQLLQLLLSSTVWDRLDEARLRSALRAVLEGPALDPPDDDRPRNTLLELVAAAFLADRFSISLTKNAEDVRLEHAHLGQGAVECKRPKNFDNIKPNLNAIGSQLRAREATGSRFGVAVIGGDRIARLASQAHEAPSAEVAESAMQDIAKLIADRMLRDAWDVACELLPTASYGIVIVTGSVLVREPVHVRPICQTIDLHLPRSSVSAAIDKAFKPRPGGPVSSFMVHAQTVDSRSLGSAEDSISLTALDSDIRLVPSGDKDA